MTHARMSQGVGLSSASQGHHACDDHELWRVGRGDSAMVNLRLLLVSAGARLPALDPGSAPS